MMPYQARVIDEKRQLDEKLAKLDSFGRTDAFKQLSAEESGRLQRQHSIMEDYSEILRQRIEAFGPLKVTIMVNGINKEVAPELTYEDIVRLAEYPAGSYPSCTWGAIGDQSRGGMLHHGQKIAIIGNEYFTVCNTGNA